MSENLRLYTCALYGFDHVVRLAPQDAWDSASPCEGWTARHVLGHVNAIQHYIASLIDGRPPTMDPMNDPDRHAGSDPASTWSDTKWTLLEKIDHPGVLGRTVDSFWGRITIDEVLGFNVGDTTVHTWDLAHALGVDDRLDPRLVARSIELYEPIVEDLRSASVVGPPVEAAATDDLQARLLSLLGRRPTPATAR